MTALHDLEIAELSALIASGDVSPVDVTEATLDRIAALDDSLRSFASVMGDTAQAAAREAEADIVAGRRIGPLHGVPIGIKDLLWTTDAPTAAGSVIHSDFRPDRDATVVRRLREAGAIIIGKLQMTEGAYSEHHPSITAPLNPWDADYWTGISSSGPGAAVAAGMCYGAIASDTGGSIRWPCAATGLTGLKPSWGCVSRFGAFELAASLDHIGPMARSAVDVALLQQAIAGPDPLDPTTSPAVAPAPLARSSLTGLTIGVDHAWSDDDVEAVPRAALSDAIGVFRSLGASIVDVTVPDVGDAVADWPDICAIEAAVAHSATYPSRRSEYGPVLAGVIDRGRSLTAIDYQRLLLRRMAVRGRFDLLFADIDMLLCPVQPFAPLTLARVGTMGERPELIAQLQRFTCPFNLTGTPTLTLPGGMDDHGMPVAVQLAAGLRREAVLLEAAAAFQSVTAWHRRHPPRTRDA